MPGKVEIRFQFDYDGGGKAKGGLGTLFVNGEKVGETKGYNLPRKYTVPGKLVKAGRNVIAVRVFDTGGGGGIYGQAADMTLAPAGNGAAAEAISLASEWQYKVEFALLEKPAQRPKLAKILDAIRSQGIGGVQIQTIDGKTCTLSAYAGVVNAQVGT